MDVKKDRSLIQRRDDGDVADLANELGRDLLDDIVRTINVALRVLPTGRGLAVA